MAPNCYFCLDFLGTMNALLAGDSLLTDLMALNDASLHPPGVPSGICPTAEKHSLAGRAFRAEGNVSQSPPGVEGRRGSLCVARASWRGETATGPAWVVLASALVQQAPSPATCSQICLWASPWPNWCVGQIQVGKGEQNLQGGKKG